MRPDHRRVLSGGLIRNAAQTAAFLAAEAGTGLTRAALEQAVRRELVKDGRWVRDDDFPTDGTGERP